MSSALYFLADNAVDNDLWMHVFTGRLIWSTAAVPRVDAFSYTAAGLPWIDHEWLTQTLFAAIFATVGATGLWLVKLGIGLLTVWLMWRQVARVTTSPWARGPAMILAIAAMARGYAVRPQIISYLGIAALFAGLDWLAHARHRRATATMLAATAAAFALWANAHGGVVVGVAVLVLLAAAPGTDRAWVSWPLRLGFPAAAIAGACFNPYGPSLFAYVAAELRTPHPLTEWQPVHPLDPQMWPTLLLMLVVASTLHWSRLLWQRPWWGAALAGFAVMTLLHQRHAPLFAIAAAAPLADQLDAVLAALAQRTRLRLSAMPQAALAIGISAIAVAQLGLLGERIAAARGGMVFAAADYPVAAFNFLHENHIEGNLGLPLDWGGYALWHGAPALKVSLDGRFATLYPPSVVADNFAFFSGDASDRATALLDVYDTTLVMMPRGVPAAVRYRPGWHLLYADDTAEVFILRDVAGVAHGTSPHGSLPFP